MDRRLRVGVVGGRRGLTLARACQVVGMQGERPYFDAYRGVMASLAGIFGLRSLLRGSVPVVIPDLRHEAVRREYESDDWNGLEAPPE